MNELKVFENSEFGKLHIMLIEGKEYFPATECAKVLGYARPADAVRDHCKGVVKMPTPSNGGIQEKGFIPEGDLYRLIIRSKLPAAERFEKWVFDEVLPELRKTGSYSTDKKKAELEEIRQKEADAKKMNAQSRQAALWLKMAEKAPNSEIHQQICAAYASKALEGHMVFPLPVVEKTYTAVEVGARYGISANKVGRIANAHGMKTKEYGMYVMDKAPNSMKDIETFRYNEVGAAKIGEYLRMEG